MSLYNKYSHNYELGNTPQACCEWIYMEIKSLHAWTKLNNKSICAILQEIETSHKSKHNKLSNRNKIIQFIITGLYG